MKIENTKIKDIKIITPKVFNSWIQILLKLPDSILWLYNDNNTGRKNLLQRCVNNLVNNSIKYANKIEIKVEKLKKNIFIYVDDDGP